MLVDDHGAVDAGVLGDEPGGLLEARCGRSRRRAPRRRSSLSSSSALAARIRATPPPGTMPSSIAARVACRASSTRAFRSFISVSVAAPTLIWATPPASLASRSWSFSRSYSLSVCVDLAADQLGPALDRLVRAGALDDRRVLAVDRDLLGPAEVGELDVLELDAQVLEDRLAAGQDGDVAEHRLAAVAVAGGLDGADLEDAAELVDDQGRQGLALDVLGDDQQRLVGLGDLSRAAGSASWAC